MPTETINICIVITEKSTEPFIQKIQEAQERASIIELRVDNLDAISPECLSSVLKHCQVPYVLCCRHKNEGGDFQGTRAEQYKILEKANDLHADYIDIDLAIANDIQFTQKKSSRIISFHDFNQTPSIAALNTIADQMRKHQADILKFAVHVNNQADQMRLLTFLASKPEHEQWIIVGMGEQGKLSRLLSPYLGGFLSFASYKNNSSAPGQIDIALMQSAYDKIDEALNS